MSDIENQAEALRDGAEVALDATLELGAENQRLRERVAGLEAEVPYLKHLSVEGGALDITIEGAKAVTRMMAESLAEMFRAEKAVNYVQYEVRSGEHDYILLLQAREKKTPHQLRQEAEASRDAALARVAELERETGHSDQRLADLHDRMTSTAAERDAALELVKTVTEELTANGAEWEKEASKRLAQVAEAQLEADIRKGDEFIGAVERAEKAERERDEARADRDVYRRVLEAIGAFLKTGAVDPFAEQKSTVFLAVRELRDERDEARTELATLRAQAETAADALLDVGAEMLRLQGRAAKLGEALAIERNHACHCDFLADGSECASCERIDAALEETPRG